jgi:hypothetical protein
MKEERKVSEEEINVNIKIKFNNRILRREQG